MKNDPFTLRISNQRSYRSQWKGQEKGFETLPDNQAHRRCQLNYLLSHTPPLTVRPNPPLPLLLSGGCSKDNLAALAQNRDIALLPFQEHDCIILHQHPPSLTWQSQRSCCAPSLGDLPHFPKPWNSLASGQLFIDFLMVCFVVFTEDIYQKKKKINKGEEIPQNILKIH